MASSEIEQLQAMATFHGLLLRSVYVICAWLCSTPSLHTCINAGAGAVHWIPHTGGLKLLKGRTEHFNFGMLLESSFRCGKQLWSHGVRVSGILSFMLKGCP